MARSAIRNIDDFPFLEQNAIRRTLRRGIPALLAADHYYQQACQYPSADSSIFHIKKNFSNGYWEMRTGANPETPGLALPVKRKREKRSDYNFNDCV